MPTKPPPPSLLWFALLPTLLGAVALCIVIAFAVDQYRFVAHADRVAGVVTAMRQGGTDSKGQPSKTQSARVAYVDKQGRVHTLTSRLSSNPPAFSEGESVVVLVEPGAADPRAVIDTFGELWLACLLFGFMGSVFLAVGCFVFYVGWARIFHLKRKRKRRSAPPSAL